MENNNRMTGLSKGLNKRHADRGTQRKAQQQDEERLPKWHLLKGKIQLVLTGPVLNLWPLQTFWFHSSHRTLVISIYLIINKNPDLVISLISLLAGSNPLLSVPSHTHNNKQDGFKQETPASEKYIKVCILSNSQSVFEPYIFFKHSE